MAVGTVKWFNDAKGFGFIEPEGGGADVFAHFSAIRMEGFRTLRQGSKVSFDVARGAEGATCTKHPADRCGFVRRPPSKAHPATRSP